MDPETFESASVTAFGWSQKVFQDHFMKCKWSLQVFRHHQVRFVNIYISWNGLGKTFHDHPKSGADA